MIIGSAGYWLVTGGCAAILKVCVCGGGVILKTIPIRFYVDTILQEFFYNGKNLCLDCSDYKQMGKGQIWRSKFNIESYQNCVHWRSMKNSILEHQNLD